MFRGLSSWTPHSAHRPESAGVCPAPPPRLGVEPSTEAWRGLSDPADSGSGVPGPLPQPLPTCLLGPLLPSRAGGGICLSVGGRAHHLPGGLAAVVEAVERERPLLTVVLLHGDVTLQRLWGHVGHRRAGSPWGPGAFGAFLPSSEDQRLPRPQAGFCILPAAGRPPPGNASNNLVSERL